MTALSVNESGNEASSPLSTAYQRSSPLPTPAGYVSITADSVSTISSASGSMLNTARNAPYDGVGASRRLDCAGNWVNAQDSVDSRIVNAVPTGPLFMAPMIIPPFGVASEPSQSGWLADDGGGHPLHGQRHDGIPDTWRWRMA